MTEFASIHCRDSAGAWIYKDVILRAVPGMKTTLRRYFDIQHNYRTKHIKIQRSEEETANWMVKTHSQTAYYKVTR